MSSLLHKAKRELLELARIALPVVGTNFVNFGAGVTDQVRLLLWHSRSHKFRALFFFFFF